MALKLGELLIKAGLITPMELDEALNSQIIFGGKLGTNLIEMGCIQEDELARFLGKVTGLPAVKPEEFKAIPPEIISLIPAQVAGKYQMVPLSLNKKRLTVAMADPSDFAAVDEISFATGLIIIPMIASEMTINRYMETYYQIKRKARSVRLKGKGRQREKQQEAEAVEELPENNGQAFEDPSAVEFPSLDEFKGFHAEETAPLIDEDPFAAAPSDKGEETERRMTAESMSLQLAKAKDRDTVAGLLLEYTALHFDRTAIFIVKGDSLSGWKAVDSSRPVADFQQLKMPLNLPSVLRQVVQEKKFYLGPVPDTAGNQKMLAGLGGGHPSMVLLIPLLLLNRVVAIFYVEGSVSSLGEKLVELQKVASKATMALEILILKNKIMMT